MPKAAARRSTFPSKRKPSRFVGSNSIALNVAAGEYSFAVRAAQHRACRRQPKRSLLVHGHVCLAVDQHIRKVRVRGPVLMQRRPAPVLCRLAEAMLPVQPLPLLEISLRRHSIPGLVEATALPKQILPLALRIRLFLPPLLRVGAPRPVLNLHRWSQAFRHGCCGV